jgi:DNA-binding NarL/FixJ family response regulator
MAKSTIRVLVADDYEPFRRFVASELSRRPELQVIEELSDGLEAVRRAQELQPDLILLDIGLPTLNGIEGSRRIREHSPKSKILFFSENSSWDIVEEALCTGASGYVAKADAARELLAAVEAVLQGRQFVSSSLSGHHFSDHCDEHTGDHARLKDVAPFPPHKGGIVGQHEVVFYSDDRQLLDRASQFIGAALKSGSAAVVVATESHRDGLARKLQAYGVDIAADIKQGRYIVLDADDALSMFMVDGVLEPARFLEIFGELILKAASAADENHRRVACFGEAADLLWRQGKKGAAIKDEELCNEVCKRYAVNILCGYSIGKNQDVVDEQFLQEICAEHSVAYRIGVS